MESIVEMDLQVDLSPMEQAGLVMRILGARVQVVEQVSEPRRRRSFVLRAS